MIAEVYPPSHGIWHVGRDTDDDLTYRRVPAVDATNPRGGNRFDSYSGNYGTLYFATDLDVCFSETLARFRPNVVLADLVREEWEASHMMGPGNIPADWRHTRVSTRVQVENPLPFVNLAHADSIIQLNLQADLMAGLAYFGIEEIDLGNLTGRDRRVTRYIAEYLAAQRSEENRPRYSGVRYLSRLGERYECWGLFEGTSFAVVERRAIERNAPELQRVTSQYGLIVH